MQGFVYILKNESMPGLLKIGKTTRIPDERSKELYTTGVPTPFEIVAAIYCEDIDELELDIHEELEKSRVSAQREFFNIYEEVAVQSLLRCYLGGSCLTVMDVDITLDEGDVQRYAHLLGVHPASIPHIVNEFNQNEWNAAAARHAEKVERRRRKRSSESNEV